MTDDAHNYEGLPIWEQIRLLNEWSPLLGFGQRFLAESDIHKRVLIVADAMEWLAAKTSTKLDDELVGHVDEVLRTPQGEAVVRWVVKRLEVR
jgi:hypothetical protein